MRQRGTRSRSSLDQINGLARSSEIQLAIAADRKITISTNSALPRASSSHRRQDVRGPPVHLPDEPNVTSRQFSEGRLITGNQDRIHRDVSAHRPR